ncbi:MAG: hypothetical protein P1U89_21355 [Verrucomicrobiales bacterium]|nr:hypothetical protein [Verrucomicrobiales bacterium]
MFRFFVPNTQTEVDIDAPKDRSLPLLRIFFILYMVSFVFDYKAVDLEFGATSTGGSPFQYAYLGIAMLAGMVGTLLGFKYLLTRPGVFIAGLWWGLTLFAIVVSFTSGNELGRILRLLIPSLLVGFAINLTLIVASAGMRPKEAMRIFFVVAVTNVIWRFVFGAFLSGLSINEARMGILSPGMRFLFAWSACALLLRKKFTPWVLVGFGVPLAVAALSITRSLVLPIGASFGTAFCVMGLGIFLKVYDIKHAIRKVGALFGFGIACLFIIVIAAIAVPSMAQRWEQRLFDNRGSGDNVRGETTEDLSTLMRKAEAKSMWDILAKDPHTFIYGKGLGASYYWDETFYPELFLVYPEDRHQFPLDIYSAGHSIWTYTLFSRGFVGVFLLLLSFFVCMGMSLHTFYLNSRTVAGKRSPDIFLVAFPFVAMWAVLSESITLNPFDERYTGVLYGFILAFPQFFYNRICYLRFREERTFSAPQMIIDQDLIDSDEELVNDYGLNAGASFPQKQGHGKAFT